MNLCVANRAAFLACLAVLACAIASLAACSGPRLPHPPYVSHPTSALDEVPAPPPPPLVENVPEQPAKEAVWVDGEWRYSARQWRWNYGYWVVPVSGHAFSPPVEVRGADGTLYYAPGIWRNGLGEAVEDPEPLARGRSQGGNSIMNPSGERENVGRSRPRPGERPPGGGPPGGPRP